MAPGPVEGRAAVAEGLRGVVGGAVTSLGHAPGVFHAPNIHRTPIQAARSPAQSRRSEKT